MLLDKRNQCDVYISLAIIEVFPLACHLSDFFQRHVVSDKAEASFSIFDHLGKEFLFSRNQLEDVLLRERQFLFAKSLLVLLESGWIFEEGVQANGYHFFQCFSFVLDANLTEIKACEDFLWVVSVERSVLLKICI